MHTVKAVYTAFRDDTGDLINRGPVPGQDSEYLDPFLFLDHHGPQPRKPGNHGLPSGPHPNRGLETVTSMLKGSPSYQDTGGHGRQSVTHQPDFF